MTIEITWDDSIKESIKGQIVNSHKDEFGQWSQIDAGKNLVIFINHNRIITIEDRP